MAHRPTSEPRGEGEGRKAFLLRIDPSLFRELEAWAADELRSVNGQIEYVLRQAVRSRGKGGTERGRGRAREPLRAPGSPRGLSG